MCASRFCCAPQAPTTAQHLQELGAVHEGKTDQELIPPARRANEDLLDTLQGLPAGINESVNNEVHCLIHSLDNSTNSVPPSSGHGHSKDRNDTKVPAARLICHGELRRSG